MTHPAAAITQPSLDLSGFVNAFPGAVAFLDSSFLIRHVNQGFLDLTGRQADSLLGHAIWTAFPQQRADQVNAWLPALLAVHTTRQTQTLSGSGANPGQTETDRQGNDPDWVLSPVPGEGGQLAGIILQTREQTSPRQEQASREKQQEQRNQELLQAIHQNLNDVVWDCDLSTNHVWWSSGFKTAFGYPPQEANRIADCWYARIHPEDAARVIAGMQQVIDSDLTLWSDVYRFKKKNGEYADLLTRGSVLRDAQGKGYRMIGTMVDITLHRKEEVKQPAKALSRAYSLAY